MESTKEFAIDIFENEVKGVILRSLCEEYERGEKCTSYFLSMEKYRAKQKTINRLKTSDGSYTTDPKIILKEVKSFYEQLYSKNNTVDPESGADFVANTDIPKTSANRPIGRC